MCAEKKEFERITFLEIMEVKTVKLKKSIN